MTPSEFGLHRVASSELTRLLRALHRGALPSPVTRSALIEKAFGHIEAHLDLVVGRDLAAAKALVVAVLSERAGGGTTQKSATSLVYMGPPAPATRSRDTFEQVRELLASATKSVHLYGLSTGDDRGVLRTVQALMSGREVRARLVFESDGSADALSRVRSLVRARMNDARLLELFVCTGAALRARAVVVDSERVLVTAGELTGAEEDGYIALGVLARDVEIARAIEDEWTKLCAVGVVQQVSLDQP